MDYRGDYFPDEENEGLSKSAINRKRIRRILFYGLAFIFYMIFFVRFFISCDADMINNVYLSDEAKQLYKANPEEFTVYKINTKEFMNYDGTIQLKNIVYAETAGELEIGVKYKANIAKNSDGGTADGYPFDYLLTDNLGTKYEICGRVSENRYGYVYERISFKRVKLDFQYNDLNNPEKDEGDAYVDEDSERNLKLSLTVSNPAVDFFENPLLIYDIHTTYERLKDVKLSV